MTTIDVEPSWEAIARVLLLLVEDGVDEKAKQDGRDGIIDMGQKLALVREAQKQGEAIAEPGAPPEQPEQPDYFSDYEYGDYLLVDQFNHIKAVSGNSDFWDDVEATPGVNEFDDEYSIVRVIRVNKDIQI